jgi:hypothetical protein
MPVFVRIIWFDDHDQLRVRLPMKLVCNLLNLDIPKQIGEDKAAVGVY